MMTVLGMALVRVGLSSDSRGRSALHTSLCNWAASQLQLMLCCRPAEVPSARLWAVVLGVLGVWLPLTGSLTFEEQSHEHDKASVLVHSRALLCCLGIHYALPGHLRHAHGWYCTYMGTSTATVVARKNVNAGIGVDVSGPTPSQNGVAGVKAARGEGRSCSWYAGGVREDMLMVCVVQTRVDGMIIEVSHGFAGVSVLGTLVGMMSSHVRHDHVNVSSHVAFCIATIACRPDVHCSSSCPTSCHTKPTRE